MQTSTTNPLISLSPQALDFLQCATLPVRNHLISMIHDKAQQPGDQMVVLSMTFECSEHIYRAMKSYVYRPGIRIVFHVVRHASHIHVDRIAWRDCDPYQDGK